MCLIKSETDRHVESHGSYLKKVTKLSQGVNRERQTLRAERCWDCDLPGLLIDWMPRWTSVQESVKEKEQKDA